ncbi:hypothetical protein [Actinophytocola gossypii]|uniref:Uncharacterized protein n=1 Tax=Actinophytocola gossypii TaxID=2812003 RepID=A0ABT2J837_9PSEU|nr:hypothetical protein [Actinophytocola gossypii]MCT2583449.1 hypothetical protein [Actinophytocola gossypii]
MTFSSASRRYGTLTLALLALVTAANGLALVLNIDGWVRRASGPGSVGEAVLNPASVGTALSVVALVGIVGTWLRRTWGPPLYFATQTIGFVLHLVVGAGLVGAVPLALAGLLWWSAGRPR